MANDTSSLVGSFQGAFISDLLEEFRRDFMRTVFRCMVIPKEAEDDWGNEVRIKHAENLRSFFQKTIGDWVKDYEDFFNEHIPLGIKKSFEDLHYIGNDFLKNYSSDKTYKEVWSELHSVSFSNFLHAKPWQNFGQESDERSLCGIFGIAAFTIHDRKCRLIQPPPMGTEGYEHLSSFFPHTEIETLRKLHSSFLSESKDYHFELRDDFGVWPAVHTGRTAVCYDTRQYQHLESGGGKSYWEKNRAVRCAAFIQICPNAKAQQLERVGFLQLKCCLPGFVDAIMPQSYQKSRKSLYVDGNAILTLRGANEAERNNWLIDFSDEWWDLKVEDDQCPVLFSRLRKRSKQWVDRLHGAFTLCKYVADSLERALLEREQRRYRERLGLLDAPLEEMLQAVSRLATAGYEVSSIVRDPSDTVFGVHRDVAYLFTENSGSLCILSDHEITLIHGLGYDLNKEDHQKSLRALMALLLLKWTRCPEQLTNVAFEELIAIAVKWLDEFKKGSHNVKLAGLIGKILIGDTMTPLSKMLEDNYDLEKLKWAAEAAKAMLFTPFKLDEHTINVLPVCVAMAVETVTIGKKEERIYGTGRPAMTKTSLKPLKSPCETSSIIQFLLGIRHEYENRSPAETPRKLKIAVDIHDATRKYSLTLAFTPSYIDSTGHENAADSQRKVAEALAAQCERNHDVERYGRRFSVHIGNFYSPYLNLVSKFSHDWRWVKLQNSGAKGDKIALIHVQHTQDEYSFIVELDISSVCRHLLLLKWEPKNGDHDEGNNSR